MSKFITKPGVGAPLGAYIDDQGVNFCLYSRHASAVYLCLYDASGHSEIARIALHKGEPGYWHVYVSGAAKGQLYGYRVDGPFAPEQGQLFNINKLLLDPYAHSHAGHYSSWYLWPMFSFQVYPGNVLNTYHWRPIDVEAVEVWRGWYTVDGEESPVIRDLAVQDRESTVEEDIHLVESQQRGYKCLGYRPGPLVIDPQGGVNSEHSIKVLQQWVREGLED